MSGYDYMILICEILKNGFIIVYVNFVNEKHF